MFCSHGLENDWIIGSLVCTTSLVVKQQMLCHMLYYIWNNIGWFSSTSAFTSVRNTKYFLWLFSLYLWVSTFSYILLHFPYPLKFCIIFNFFYLNFFVLCWFGPWSKVSLGRVLSPAAAWLSPPCMHFYCTSMICTSDPSSCFCHALSCCVIPFPQPPETFFFFFFFAQCIKIEPVPNFSVFVSGAVYKCNWHSISSIPFLLLWQFRTENKFNNGNKALNIQEKITDLIS